jgi:CHAD domain-containing protein
MMNTQTRETTILTRATAPPGQLSPADAGPPAHGRRPAHRRRFTRHSTAGEVVLAYLDAQAAKLSVLDLAVRRDKPDAVHQMRVTVRRLRSTLQSFTRIVPKAETEHLRAELKWLGGVLGAARDNEVLADHLHAGLTAVPMELVLGPAQARVTAHFAPLEASGQRALVEALDSERYQALRAELGRLLDHPPLTPEAAEPAAKALPPAVGRAFRRTRRRMRVARHAPAGQARDVALHETRKAAKRARYAAEAMRPALGKRDGDKARRLVKRTKEVQSALGGHQDAVIAREAARAIGVQAHLAGENAFSFGLLNERAHRDAVEYQRQARSVWRRAARRKARWWLAGSR